MLTHRLLTLLLFCTVNCAALPAHAQSLGRVFFTPEKRAALDRQRVLNLTQAKESGEDTPLTINGVVQRSSGKSTAWVNGAVIDETNALPGTLVTQVQRTPSQLGIGKKKLRVGDTLNPATGDHDDLLRGGTISIQPSKRELP